jgi:ribosomal protein S18 acetylase RimI-like enzyme
MCRSGARGGAFWRRSVCALCAQRGVADRQFCAPMAGIEGRFGKAILTLSPIGGMATVDAVTLTRRPATVRDKEFARCVHHLAYRDVVERQFGGWDENEQDAYFETAWSKHDHDIVEWNGEACGYFAVEMRATRVDIHELVLDPTYQNRGIGSDLLAEVVSIARGLGVPVHLRVLHKNQAVHLYERFWIRSVWLDGNASVVARQPMKWPLLPSSAAPGLALRLPVLLRTR